MSGTRRFTNLKRLARNIRDTLGTEATADTKKITISCLRITELEKQDFRVNLKI